jgi:1-acyl-sn-glycerol-3-phosphate acyltransferase
VIAGSTARVALRGVGLLGAVGRVLARPRAPVAAPAAALVLAREAARVADLHGFRTAWAGPLPPPGALLVCNHVSYLDPFAVLPLAPAIPLAKAEVAGWPLIGPSARALGVIMVRRDDLASRAVALRRIQRTLAGGARVLNFAEGTTTTGDRVAPLHHGSFGAAAMIGAPIVPVALAYEHVAIAWTGGASFVPHYLRTAAMPGLTCRVLFGEPMTVGAATPAALAAAARRQIEGLLERIRHDAAVRVRVPPPRAEPVLPAA